MVSPYFVKILKEIIKLILVLHFYKAIITACVYAPFRSFFKCVTSFSVSVLFLALQISFYIKSFGTHVYLSVVCS